jgi:protein JBTS26
LDYVGLNGIEFYDQTGSPILQTKKIDFTISAEPGSVNVLRGSEGDTRTIDKLVNGENDTMDDRNMWLAPLLNERRDALIYKTKNNEITISFDKPILLSCAKFWNYSKTITRGAKEIEIYCDDLLIYRVSHHKFYITP